MNSDDDARMPSECPMRGNRRNGPKSECPMATSDDAINPLNMVSKRYRKKEI